MTETTRHTIGRFLLDRAVQHPERIAIDDRGVATDYRTLAVRADALAQGLRDAGYGPGHRIATVSASSTDQVIAFFACALAGVAFVPLSWRLTASELSALVQRAAPELILVDEQHSTLAMEATRIAGSAAPQQTLGTSGIEAHVPAARQPVTARPVRDSDPLLVIFTSGSAAEPKGVVLTHENCFWNNLALQQALPLTADDVVLAILPQFHVAAWNVQPLLAWWAGATVVLESSFEPSRALRLIGERGVTTMMGVPTQYRMLADDASWPQARLETLRLVVVGGAPLTEDVADAWAARGIRLTAGYGLTEAGPNVLHVPAGLADAGPGTVGRPYPHVEVMIADPDTGLALEGESTGELWVRGPSVFAGYLDDPVATADAMHGEWLRTGDLAHRDADGDYAIVGRLKEIYISGGENVAPAEVEAALALHPLVAEVAVVGAPDPVWGERGVAFVVPRGGAALSADELRAHARSRLAGFKVPGHIEIVAALPTAGPHKVARAQLRERAARMMEEASHDYR
ncbi:class I adenylate-forming enzyme family protein [uncultured Demequina sp.]|uniref:class I adenylate-forming enzyme family protein n=1 Tax=uncultured Demequina sp. TaxID=693499 RepID=UPI0025EA449F|nr:AMP-binding protein [uncultured Demequina sp.]